MRVIFGSLCLAALIVSIIGWELMAAHGALVVLPEPLLNAVFVEKVPAWKLAGLILQVLAAD